MLSGPFLWSKGICDDDIGYKRKRDGIAGKRSDRCRIFLWSTRRSCPSLCRVCALFEWIGICPLDAKER